MHRTNSSCNNSSSYLYFFIIIRKIETVPPFCFCFFPLLHVDSAWFGHYVLPSVWQELLYFSRCILIKNDYICSLYSFLLFFLKIFQIYRAISIYWIMSDDIIGPLWAVVHGIKFFLRRLRSMPSYHYNILLMQRAIYISKHFCLLFVRDWKLHPVLILSIYDRKNSD